MPSSLPIEARSWALVVGPALIIAEIWVSVMRMLARLRRATAGRLHQLGIGATGCRRMYLNDWKFTTSPVSTSRSLSLARRLLSRAVGLGCSARRSRNFGGLCDEISYAFFARPFPLSLFFPYFSRSQF